MFKPLKNIYENWHSVKANLLTGMAAIATGVAGLSASASSNMNIPAVITVINPGNTSVTMGGCLAAIGVAVLGGIGLVTSDICENIRNRKSNPQNNQRQVELAKQQAERKEPVTKRLANTEVIEATDLPAAHSASATPKEQQLG